MNSDTPEALLTGSEFPGWGTLIAASTEQLRGMAGATEDEFLQIGSSLQSFYSRSVEITELARQLVSLVSGESLQEVTASLHKMIGDMETYLTGARARNTDGCATLEAVKTLLKEVSTPLEGFQKMNKTLRMLSISTKIESARLGESGSSFVNLAMDVEKLSHQVSEKSASILQQRQELAETINQSLTRVRADESAQDREVTRSIAAVLENLNQLTAVNERFSSCGAMVAAVSSEVSGDIGEVVASQQSHDITRQQIEHVVEALEKLFQKLQGWSTGSASSARDLVIESGDVCELQEAQLHFAVSELSTAVEGILANLRDIAGREGNMADELLSLSGVASSGGRSFVDGVKEGMGAVTLILADCARMDAEMHLTMQSVASTVGRITSFVKDIKQIGSEIDLIALNSQIKAVHTGSEGAALAVLAEAIKRLSDEAVVQTAAVSGTLTSIQTTTEHLSQAEQSEETVSTLDLDNELVKVVESLECINAELFQLIQGIGDRVSSLNTDVDSLTSGIQIEATIRTITDAVLKDLQNIVDQSRALAPASTQFKENLRFMEERYTMESERHIHEAIARKRGGGSAHAAVSAATFKSAPGKESDSEFGDNVDLF